jgi:hypothetical protein
MAALERCFLSELRLVQPGRVLVRDAEMTLIRVAGILQDTVVVHLFSDLITVSEETMDGFELLKVYDLKTSVVELGTPKGYPSSRFGFTVRNGTATCVLAAQTMKDLLIWVGDLRLFINRSKQGETGRPKNWSKDWMDSKYVGKKVTALKQRKISKIVSLQLLNSLEEDKEEIKEVSDALPNEAKEEKSVHRRSFSSVSPEFLEQRRVKRSHSSDSKYTSTSCNFILSSILKLLAFKPQRTKEEEVLPIEVWEEIQQQRRKEEARKQDWLSLMKAGDFFMKHTSMGSVSPRFFRLSEDGEELLWGKSKGKVNKSCNVQFSERSLSVSR